jgi:uncharacterized protein YkwD
MITDDLLINRRSFIKAAVPCLALGLRPQLTTGTPPQTQPGKLDIAACRAQLLEVVNVERGLASLSPLAHDEFADEVETRHALEMVTGSFLSHWGSDGLNPYQRYSFAGGTDYTAENVSATDQIPSLKPERVALEFVSMNIRMHNEKPPNDGHRRAILGPEATHVGFGLAINGNSLRLAELFVARYAEIEPISRTTRPGAKLTVKGKLLNRDHIFHQADVFYEPMPDRNRVRSQAGHSYGLPAEYVTLRPVLAVRMSYPDRTVGTIELGSHGQFRIPVTLKDRPGIYTVVIWIRKKRSEPLFPVTEICIKAE